MADMDLNFLRFIRKLDKDIIPHLACEGEADGKKSALGLTALFLASEAGMPISEARKYVVDEGEDFGIDGMYFNLATQKLYLVQTKFRQNQEKSVSQADMLKFKNGIESVVKNEIEGANDKFKEAYKTIRPALEDINTKIKLCVVTTSNKNPEPNCYGIIKNYCEKLNKYDSVFSYEYVKFDRVFQMAKFFSDSEGTKVDISLFDVGAIREPFQAYFGYVYGEDVASWVRAHGASLFEQNVRFTLQNSDVNEGIFSALRDTPEKFWYFNNGITAIASQVNIVPGDTNPRKIKTEMMNIVNGAQTAGMLARASEEGVDISKVRVNFRVISLSGTQPGFDEAVTRANNTQNELNALDFVSLDPRQDLIKTELAPLGYDYVFKRGAETDERLTPLEVKDAAVALACACEDIAVSVQAKRYVSGLWNNIKSEPYTKIFHEKISGKEILDKWNVYRICNEEIKIIKSSLPKDDALIFAHGDKFICYCVFETARRDGIVLTDSLKIRDVAKKIASALPSVYDRNALGYPATTFKNTRAQIELKERLDKVLDEARIL